MRPEAFAMGSACILAVLTSVFSEGALAQTATAPEAASAQTLAELGGLTVIGGVRLWANQWDVPSFQRMAVVPNPAAPTTVVLQDVEVKTLSTTKYVPIPFIGARWGNVLGLATFFPRTSYNSQNPVLGTVDRDEFDISLGYAVAPSLIISIGYKQGYQTKISGQVSPSSLTERAILIGLSGSAPIAQKLSLYGNFAYGFARQEAELPDAAGQTSFNANYQIGELGLAYTVYEGSAAQGLKSVLLTFGYRAQAFTANSIAFGTYAPGPPPVLLELNYQSQRSTTNGFVAGIVGAF